MAELTKLLTPEAIDVRPPSAGRSRYVTTTPEPGSPMAEHHHMARWVQPVLVIMAVWLATSPPILGYESLALTVSDLITAVVLTGLAWLAFKGRMWAGLGDRRGRHLVAIRAAAVLGRIEPGTNPSGCW